MFSSGQVDYAFNDGRDMNVPATPFSRGLDYVMGSIYVYQHIQEEECTASCLTVAYKKQDGPDDHVIRLVADIYCLPNGATLG
jgi:hypothetical protein